MSVYISEEWLYIVLTPWWFCSVDRIRSYLSYSHQTPPSAFLLLDQCWNKPQKSSLIIFILFTVYTGQSQGLHRPITRFTQANHKVYIGQSQVYTGQSQGLHRPITRYTHTNHKVYTGQSHGLHRPITRFTHTNHKVYTGQSQGLHRPITRFT